jgi:ribulose-phosphate 3-epimerase
MVLVMTVNPGFSGQKFLPQTISKVAEVKSMLESHRSKALIEVDGGITEETLPGVYRAGARVIVAATAIFKHPKAFQPVSRPCAAQPVKTKITAAPRFCQVMKLFD